jgi:NAD(P)-dependent dehydrogenase (short-subunit alcohol dehydrogenase family)
MAERRHIAVSSEFEGKVVVVTGAAGGIGRATVSRFLSAGAVVFASDIDGEALIRMTQEMKPISRDVNAVVADVTRVADCERLVAAAAKGGGRRDVLVNCAGVWVEGPTEQMSEEQWDRTIDVNLKGLFFCCSRAIPELKKTRGCIVNLSSDAGVVGTPETAIYTASKGGVSLLTRSLALELAKDLVRVNAVCPADVMTPMLEGQARDFGGDDPEGYLKRLLETYPQGDKARFITPDEVAELIFYLAGEKAAPITGALISIDFGSTAGYGYE